MRRREHGVESLLAARGSNGILPPGRTPSIASRSVEVVAGRVEDDEVHAGRRRHTHARTKVWASPFHFRSLIHTCAALTCARQAGAGSTGLLP